MSQKNINDYLPSRFWLMKTEPDVFSIDDLLQRQEQKEFWDGVRNYQARNFMLNEMIKGDKILFYHSNATPSGIAGVAEVLEGATPDLSALNPQSKYFDPKATLASPRWFGVTIGKPQKFPQFVSLNQLKEYKELQSMLVLRKGQRLSILPIAQNEYRFILQLGGIEK